ncbi:transport inhibitor response 1-like protein [Tanacetum coccineum]
MSCLSSEVSLSALQRLVARSPNLKTLRLNRAVQLEKLSTLLLRAPQLVEMGTGAYSADIHSDVYSSLAAAFSKCKELKSLSGFWDVDPYYLPVFYSVCSRLTFLNLSYATIESPDVSKIISQCPNLQRLWVLDYIEDSGLNTLSLSCKGLRELRVFPSDPFIADANVSLTEQGLVAVSEGCPKLQSVLYFCRQMSNSALVAIANNRPNLTCFRLCILEPRVPDYLTFEPLDTGFGAIVEQCRGLQRLSLSGLLTDRVFEYIGKHAKKLEMLSIAFAGDSDLGHIMVVGCEQGLGARDSRLRLGDRLFWLIFVSKWRQSIPFGCRSCAVSLGACNLLSRKKMPRLNVEVIDEQGDLDSRPDNCPVEKLYIYRTVAGPRLDTPSFIQTMGQDTAYRLP